MAEISLTVKVSPPDGTWQTANELVKHIASTNTIGNKLHIEVDGVFTEAKKGNNPVGVANSGIIIQNTNNVKM